MSQLREVLDSAYGVFNLAEHGRGKQNKHYIPVPARLSEEHLPTTSDSPEILYDLTNPFIFLTNIWADSAIPYNRQCVAAAPSISFIVGQYGLGKTELVYQICQYLLDNAHHKEAPIPLPINLALCRDELSRLKENTTVEDYALLLFSRILRRADLDLSFIKDELLPEIYRGRVFLILDGLDELISTTSQNYQFFSALSRFLMSGAQSSQNHPNFKIALSMRMEYLTGVGFQDASDFAAIINSSAITSVPIRIYFLKLDFLDDSRVSAYFQKRLTAGKGKITFESVCKNERLSKMLRRPLLLRIFCDLTKKQPAKQMHSLMESLKNKEHPAGLIGHFVKRAAEDAALSDDQKKLTTFTWDAKKLARKSLELYEAGRSEMNLEDVKNILKSDDPQHQNQEALDALTETEILEGIHKCPFLWKDAGSGESDSRVQVRFAHRIFFEYFVAKGILICKEEGDYRPWMNLVLNVDMRRFLKGMVPDDEWYERTKKSYAMEVQDIEIWIFKEKIDFKELENERRLFLDYMTDPENEKYIHDSDGKLAKAIHGFLDKEEYLHPRYRMYNFETVALYVWYHRWDEQGAMISKRFSEVLKKRLDQIYEDLQLEDTAARNALELLLERILHIGQRLRYTWAKEYEEKKYDILKLFRNENTKNRVEAIFDSIGKALF